MNTTPLSRRSLGTRGLHAASLGLGCMGMSDMYGTAASRDDAESIATIQAAVDAGIDFIDTGDFYGMGHNELLIAKALADTPHADPYLQEMTRATPLCRLDTPEDVANAVLLLASERAAFVTGHHLVADGGAGL